MKKDHEYALCRFCYQRKAPKYGCYLSYIIINRRIYKRIKIGSSLSTEADTGKIGKDYLCPDCNAGKGQYHHYNCFMERCPVCVEPLIGCRCKYSTPVRKYFRLHLRRLIRWTKPRRR